MFSSTHISKSACSLVFIRRSCVLAFGVKEHVLFCAPYMTTPYGFEIAVRHIAAGEQLTNDYGTLNIIEPFEPFDEGHLRKVVCPDDLATYFPLWDVQVKDAIALVNDVEQPLQPVFADDKWLQVQRLCMGEESVESLKNCLLLPSIAVGFTQQQ